MNGDHDTPLSLEEYPWCSVLLSLSCLCTCFCRQGNHHVFGRTRIERRKVRHWDVVGQAMTRGRSGGSDLVMGLER